VIGVATSRRPPKPGRLGAARRRWRAAYSSPARSRVWCGRRRRGWVASTASGGDHRISHSRSTARHTDLSVASGRTGLLGCASAESPASGHPPRKLALWASPDVECAVLLPSRIAPPPVAASGDEQAEGQEGEESGGAIHGAWRPPLGPGARVWGAGAVPATQWPPEARSGNDEPATSPPGYDSPTDVLSSCGGSARVIEAPPTHASASRPCSTPTCASPRRRAPRTPANSTPTGRSSGAPARSSGRA